MIYDYVVVGAGSAGAVVAARLSEDSRARVALVEAGGPADQPLFTESRMWPYLFGMNYDWRYQTDAEPGLRGRRLGLARGKVIGGSSSVNGMIYLRGPAWDYDHWESQGAIGWGWDSILPVFRAMEDCSLGETEYHGTGGPIRVVEPFDKHEPVASAWIEAGIEAGHAFNPDFNGASNEGVGYFWLSAENGKRVSAATAYLDPARNRENLDIFTYSQAQRILFDGTRAVGVQIEHLGESRTLEAVREVVVCGGTYNTPQLLMLSGIGHADHLLSFGIQPLIDLPVGDGMQDHPGVGFYFTSNTPGPHEWSALGESGGFFRTRDGLDVPDTETMVYPSNHGPLSEYQMGEGGHFSILVQVSRPKSRGTVRLRSPHPAANPAIVHNHFTDPDDRRTIIDALRLNLDIIDRSPLQSIITGSLLYPEDRSDQGLSTYLDEFGGGYQHPTSTCAIGSVVDPELRVFGIDGLRIADASVMPSIVGANPNATAMLIGERAAGFIRAEQMSVGQ